MLRFKRRHKYGVTSAKEARTYRGKVYPSLAERIRAEDLQTLVQSGYLQHVIEQPKLWLGVVENSYRPDFFVIDLNGAYWYEDVKGVATAQFRRNVRLWRKYGPTDLHVLTRHRSRDWSTEIIPGGMDPLCKPTD